MKELLQGRASQVHIKYLDIMEKVNFENFHKIKSFYFLFAIFILITLQGPEFAILIPLQGPEFAILIPLQGPEFPFRAQNFNYLSGSRILITL